MLTWKGEIVLDKTMRAAGRAVNSVLADCVTTAKADAPVKTSAYQGSIQMRQAFFGSGGEIIGQFGSFAINYAMAIERGTRAHVIVSTGPWSLHNKQTGQYFGRIVNHPGTRGRFVLTRAMERHGPSLPLRIQMEMGA